MYRVFLAITLGVCLLWGIAAASEIDGSWLFVFDTEGGERRASMTLTADGDKVSGKVGEDIDVTGSFTNGEVGLSFPYYSEEAGFKADVKMTGKLKEGKITGNWKFDVHTGTFTGSRSD